MHCNFYEGDTTAFELSLEEAVRKLAKTKRKISRHDILDILAEQIKVQIKTNLKNGKDFEGRNLVKLKDSTLKAKARAGQPSTPMVATGKLLSDMGIKKSRSGGILNRKTEIEIGPQSKRGKDILAVHSKGESIRERNVLRTTKRTDNKLDRAVTNDIQRIINLTLG